MSIIRKEYYEDIEAIQQLLELAFNQKAEAELVNSLRASGDVLLSLVAESDRHIVGHILFSPVSVEGCGQPMAALAPMAVVPPQQGHGIGTLLVHSGIDECRELGITALVVLGDPEFYTRFGFAPASGFGLHPSWDGVPDEAFMALELEPGSLRGCSGVVRYARAFDAVTEAPQGL